MKVKFKLLSPEAIPPRRMTSGAAGFDLYASDKGEDIFYHLPDGRSIRTRRYETGVAFEIPGGHVGLLIPRSSICRTGLRLSNSCGIIDSDYRGTVSFVFDCLAGEMHYRNGERIGQNLFIKLSDVELEEVQELSETERGQGGYGSTGR